MHTLSQTEYNNPILSRDNIPGKHCKNAFCSHIIKILIQNVVVLRFFLTACKEFYKEIKQGVGVD
jgi:hypothetical protein